VTLTPAQVRDYYHGFANRTLWPLLHNAIEKPVFMRTWWEAYRSVNERFADAATSALTSNDSALLWVHDYHLLLVPQLVRRSVPQQRSGLFMHTPWPSPDVFARIPWRKDLLLGPLGADVVSFHTDRYRKNFVRACGRLLFGDGVKVRGSDPAPTRRANGTHESVADLHGRRAVRRAGDQPPDRRRHRPAAGAELRSQVEQNRLHQRSVHPAGQGRPRPLPVPAAAAAVADGVLRRRRVMLVTPLADGMNLVAKEYVAVQHARGCAGVLVLSEFTGSPAELGEALLCNPFDVDGLSALLEQALKTPERVRRRAMTAMARGVVTHDVHRWVDAQLGDISSAG
jgi:trehalose 6-phosphate synthase